MGCIMCDPRPEIIRHAVPFRFFMIGFAGVFRILSGVQRRVLNQTEKIMPEALHLWVSDREIIKYSSFLESYLLRGGHNLKSQ
jgi:hypothetical protein